MPPVNLNSQPQAPPDVDATEVGGLAVLSADLKGNITSCNQDALKIFGCSAADVRGRTLAAFISGEDGTEQSQLHKTMLAEVLEDGQYRSSHRCQNRAEKQFTAELTVTLLRDGKSVPVGMVALLSVAKARPNLSSVQTKAQASEGSEEDEAAHIRLARD